MSRTATRKILQLLYSRCLCHVYGWLFFRILVSKVVYVKYSLTYKTNCEDSVIQFMHVILIYIRLGSIYVIKSIRSDKGNAKISKHMVHKWILMKKNREIRAISKGIIDFRFFGFFLGLGKELIRAKEFQHYMCNIYTYLQLD